MKPFIFLMTCLFLVSCTKEENNNILEEKTSYFFYPNSKLEITTSSDTYMQWANITEGNHLVFEYYYQSETNILIADHGYSETIRFEIPKDLNEFNYQDDELINIKANYFKSCFCYFPTDETKMVTPTGVINGKKINDNEWEINIDVTFYGNEKQTVSKKFLLSSN